MSYKKNIGIKSPCMDCDSRAIGCHSDCEMYNLYKAKVKMKNKNFRKNKNVLRAELRSLYWTTMTSRERK